MPSASRHSPPHMRAVPDWIPDPLGTMPLPVAVGTGRDDVVAGIAPAALTWHEMFGRALEPPQLGDPNSKPLRKILRLAVPHRMVAVEASTALGKKRGLAGLDQGGFGHRGLRELGVPVGPRGH